MLRRINGVQGAAMFRLRTKFSATAVLVLAAASVAVSPGRPAAATTDGHSLSAASVAVANSPHKPAGIISSPSGTAIILVKEDSSRRYWESRGYATKAVAYSISDLKETRDEILDSPFGASEGFVSAGIDPSESKVILRVTPDALKEAQRLYGKADDVSVGTAEAEDSPAASSIGGWATSGCSAGLNGYAYNRTVMYWVGHCAKPPLGKVISNGTGRLGVSISSRWQNNGRDMAIIDFDSNVSTAPQVARFVGGTVTVSGVAAPFYGMNVCKYGTVTGRTCGTVRQIGTAVKYGTVRILGLIGTTACILSGDSGGPLMDGTSTYTRAVGLVSGGPDPRPACGRNSGYTNAYSSGKMSWMTNVSEMTSYYGGSLKTG